jgi:type IV pilus assembly protein PilV
VRQPISMQNELGFTLVELLVAMVIMMVGLLGLLQSVNIALEYNLKNQMRGEVVRVAQDAMNDMRSRAFDSVSSKTTTVPTSLRNINRTYTVRRSVYLTGSDVSRKYQVDVIWKYKNVSTTHSVMTVRSRAE